MERTGSAGGRETLRRHGVEHFREIGKRGIRATADRHFGGSIAEAMAWLRKKAGEFSIARGVDEKLDAKLAGGEEIASVELPVILSPDDDMLYAEPSWRERVRRRGSAEVNLPS